MGPDFILCYVETLGCDEYFTYGMEVLSGFHGQTERE